MVSTNPRSDVETLTDRERDILGLLNEGLSDRAIAEQRVLTLGTVKWYNHQIYEKLGVSSRTQAINRARELGLLNSNYAVPSPTTTPLKHNLPAETTRFIGREREIDEIKSLLRTTRLLTLTGSPGTGKTRLALHICAEVLADFPDGVYFVNLASVREPAYVAVSIADALRIEERTDEPLIDTIKSTLRNQHLLLVLDNFEHLLRAVSLIPDLLASAPRLKILVTSREVLRVYGEQEYTVPPLQLPDTDDLAMVAQSEAVVLFVQQARAVKPDFVLTDESRLDIARICIRLDGLPLAIELAAAHSKLLSPQALLKRLQHPFDTLIKGPRDLPVRQQTLRQTIDWSYNLLAESERILFARLSIFSGGWTLEAMQEVCGDKLLLDTFEGLESLVNKSLIRQYEIHGTPRFTMLETLREYALEQLEAGSELDMLHRQHARYYTELAELVEQGLQGVKERSTLDNLELEHDNFRAVLSWSLTSDPEPGLRLIAALGQCWRMRGHLLEGWRWSKSLLENRGQADTIVVASALASASMVAFHLGNHLQSEQMGREALALARQTGTSTILGWASYAAGLAMIQPRMTAHEQQEANALLDDALDIFRPQHHVLGIAKSLTAKGELFRAHAALKEASAAYEEAVALFSQLANTAGISVNLANLAWISLRLDDDTRAEQLFHQSLALAQQIHDRGGSINAVAGLAALLVKAHKLEQAAQLFGAIEMQKNAYGNALCAADQADYEPFIDIARTQMDQTAFDLHWEVGRKLTLEQAIVCVSDQT